MLLDGTLKAGKSLQVGANMGQKLTVAVASMNGKGIGIGNNASTVLVSNAAEASKALATVDAAIAKVSEQRSKLGALQNRLEHTLKNLNNAAENTQAAESRIRDTDMAKEMSKFTRDNILAQASQAMLAQANQLP